MVNAGATWLDQEVVRDDNWLTSRGPQDMAPFVREMIRLYAGGPASKGALRRRDSDPQRERPAPWATAAMRLMPYASMGTVLGIALIGGGLLAASRANAGTGQPGAASR